MLFGWRLTRNHASGLAAQVDCGLSTIHFPSAGSIHGLLLTVAITRVFTSHAVPAFAFTMARTLTTRCLYSNS